MEKLENIYKSYSEANKNKDYLLEGDNSKAEVVMSSCFYALAMHSEYDIDFDLGEVIKILILKSLNPEIILNLNKKDEYIASLKNINVRVADLCERESQKVADKKYELAEFTNIYNFYNNLKKHSRAGHILWGINKERIESISEHIYGCLVLAILMDSQSDIEFDLNHVLEMLVIHETEEISRGDYTVFDPADGAELNESVELVLGKSKKKPIYLELLDEYEGKTTNDSKVAYKIDKIEYDLQVKINDELGLYDFNNLPKNKCTMSDAVQKIISDGAQSVFDVHYVFDQDKFKDKDDFALLLDYARKRK